MGDLIAALKFTEGKYSSNMMKLILLTALAAVALAEPEPHYGYYGYPYYHQLGWPSVRAPGFSSTCWGCRGKRSAEVDNVNRVSGSSPFPSYTAAWPGATVSVNHMGKRSAEPEPHGFYGYYGYPYGYYGYPYYHHPLKVVDGAAGVHPGGATSSVSRSPQGLRGKRSAEVDNVNRVSGASPFPSYTAAWPGATVSVDHGKRKRSAEPHGYFGYYGHPFYYHPYAYFHGPAAKPAAIDGDAYTAEWPGATVSVDHIAKRSAELVDNVNQVSGSSPFPSYTAAWPGATVSVDHGK